MPIEPTKEMIEAALYAFNDVHADEPRPSLRDGFATALRAALAIQPREGGGVLPIEPSEEALKRAQELICGLPRYLAGDHRNVRDALRAAYAIDAAPLAPATTGRGWISTKDALPEKPGKAHYEQIPCLIYIKGEVRISLWNCEHLVWDDAEGDDFMAEPREPTHWQPLPPAPTQEA